MNKTIVIASGASLASLAAGAAGGYFYARNQFNKTIDKTVARETAAVKKHYGILLAQAKEEKPPLEELAKKATVETEDDEPSDAEILEAEANKALTNYQGLSTKKVRQQEKPALDTLVENNIFGSNGSKKPKMPPRDEHGKFIPAQTVTKEPTVPDDPYLISHEEFFLNDPEYDQENILWFVTNKVLLKSFTEEHEEIPIGHVGEVNLTLFDPTIPDDEDNIICVRNDGLEVDYEIKLMHMDLTEYLGLGTEEGTDFEYDEELS